jgi:putative ABC transport system permease protein
MRLMRALRVAVDSLRAGGLRSFLAMFGVVIGVSSVVVLVALGNGAKREVAAQVEGLGSNLLLVVSGKVELSVPSISRINLSDVDAVARVVGDRDRVTASVTSGETVRVGMKSTYTTVRGVLNNSMKVFVRGMAHGEYLSKVDVAAARRVAVLGSAVAQSLFGDRDPVGAQISIAGVRFRVIGLFAPLGQSLGVDRDDEVHIPITTAQRLFETQRVDGLGINAPDRETMDSLGQRVVAELTKRHPDNEFSAVTQGQIIGVLAVVLQVLTGVLAGIACVSLLVAGVGVSNIMLVSVRERTREIGLRKAVGARPSDIGLQFLLEAVLLTTCGGVIGIALGVGAAQVVDRLTPIPTAPTWWSVVLACCVSAGVGIVFGMVPALRARRLDPVAALRTE